MRDSIIRIFSLMTATLYLTGIIPFQHCRRPPPNPLMYSRLIVTTCLYTSALLIAELGRSIYP